MGSPATVTASGQSARTFSYAIPAKSAFKLVTAGTAAAASSGSVRVIPDFNSAAPTALAVFSYAPSGITVSEAGVHSISGTAFRMYAETSGTLGGAGSIQSGIAFANPTTSPATVNLELFNSGGNLAAAPITVIVPPSGQAAKFLNDLFPNLKQPFQGLLRISSNAAGLAVAGLRARYNERGDFLMTTTPPVSESSAPPSGQLLFPQLAVGGGFSARLILFSSRGTPSGTVNFVSQSGLPWAVATQ